MISKAISFLMLLIVLTACSSNDNDRIDNPNLINVSFRLNINLNLPEYNSLNFPGNSYSTYNTGINGVVIYNINNTQFTAFELSDPNHPLNECSSLRVEGVIAKCDCNDGNSYNILTGELTNGSGQYTMKPYRITKNGNMLEVFN
ncbi:hypothetical protein [Gillisia marina]|uniref:hypothetical protein n=1 Tax=Gillisia marina TaxID=1167637 RepID=UPI00029B0DBF|nr:hypothetical protein [Gillisia marina]